MPSVGVKKGASDTVSAACCLRETLREYQGTCSGSHFFLLKPYVETQNRNVEHGQLRRQGIGWTACRLSNSAGLYYAPDMIEMLSTSDRNDRKWIGILGSRKPQRKRDPDLYVELECNGEWLQKRIFWTEEEILFVDLDADSHFDSIPISEVECLKPICLPNDLETSFSTGDNDEKKFIRLQTAPTGIKRGKSYMLKAYSESERDVILEDLNLHMQSTKSRSYFQILLYKHQRIARKIHESVLFQRITAALIVAVRK